MKKNERITERVVMAASCVVGILVLLVLVQLVVSSNIEQYSARAEWKAVPLQAMQYTEQIDRTAPVGVTETYHFEVPASLEHDTHLAFYTVHQYAQVTLDGEVIYKLMPSSELTRVKTVGSNWNMVPIYQEDGGKELLITVIPVYESVRHRAIEVWLGSSLSIYQKKLSWNLPIILLSAISILVGIIFCFLAWNHYVANRKGKELLAIGIFSILLGTWRILDNRFSPFLWPEKPVLLFYVALLCLMLCVLPIMRARREQRNALMVDGFCITVCGIYIVLLLLQLCGVLDLRETLYLTHGIILIGFLLLISSSVKKYRDMRAERRMRDDVTGDWEHLSDYVLLFLLIGTLIDITIFYVRGSSSGLLFTVLAFLCYVICEGVQAILRYVRQEKQLAEQQQQILEGRIVSMMSQIRAHFIFNILNAISGMCKYDPEQADRTVVCFARYLRNNIDILENDEPVPFFTELRQLEDYVALEQIRFGDKIRFETDILAENFLIPPLILQPIVENAIKHGLLPKEGGGTILLRTWEDETANWILVQDDGIGFDSSVPTSSEAVGLKNVRTRLHDWVQGQLFLESTPGTGTIVTINIPKEKEQK